MVILPQKRLKTGHFVRFCGKTLYNLYNMAYFGHMAPFGRYTLLSVIYTVYIYIPTYRRGEQI